MKKISFRKTNAPLIEIIAKTVLWLGAGSAIAILIWIVASVLFQGFISVSKSIYDVLPKGDITFSFGHDKSELILIINSKVKTDELTAKDIIDFYQGQKTDWVYIGQDLQVIPVGYPVSNKIAIELLEVLAKAELELKSNLLEIESEDEFIKRILEDPIYCGFARQKIITKLPKELKAIQVSDLNQEELVFVVHKNVDLDSLSCEDLYKLYKGDSMTLSLKGQATDINLVLLENVKNNSSFKKILTYGSYLVNCKILNSEEEVIEYIAQTAGAIGFLPANFFTKVKDKREIKVSRLRNLTLIANNNLFAMHNNKQLNVINEKQLEDLLSSKIKNWAELEGINASPSLVLLTKDYSERRLLEKLYPHLSFANRTSFIEVSSLTDFRQTLLVENGAIGVCNYFSFYNSKQLKILPVEREEINANLTLDFILEAPTKASKAGGISTIIGNTIVLIIITIFFSSIIGIGAGIFFAEYAKSSKLVSSLRFFTETLAGIPSIIYGLFGYILFRTIMGIKEGLLSAGLTLMIMVLPTIIRTTEEALKAVPQAYREESLALGATHWQTIRRLILPAASSGILTGIILAIGRVIGETAAVLFTCGSSTRFVLDQGLNFEALTKSARVLALHIYILFREGGGNPRAFQMAFASATILVIVILIINLISVGLIRRLNKMKTIK